MTLTLRTALMAWGLALLMSAGAHGQIAPPTPRERTGGELYRAACAACHAIDGTGASRSLVGFEVALPDFTNCAFTSVEPYADWLAIAHQGGPVRGFDRRMPAFGEALAEDELLRIIEHLKGFCDDPAWAPGDLNLPRALVTEKAFPENEAVLTTTVGGSERGAVTNEVLYEKRFGSRNQLEVAVPLALRESVTGWARGLGDVKIAVKRVLHHSLAAGRIVSAAGEVVLPSGKESLGLGRGVTILEPFLAAGQLLPRNSFVHVQAGAELPLDRDVAATETFWRAALGITFEQGRFGRAWSPIVEILGSREMKSSQRAQWDVVPQMQMTLNRRQHLMINAGVRLPLTDRGERHPQVITYFLWDWFDGGLGDGW